VSDASIDPAASPSETPAAVPVAGRTGRLRVAPQTWWWLGAAVLVLVSLTSLAVAWKAQSRVHEIEQELVRRQQDSQTIATEARTLARQAQDSARDAAAKAALLDARVAEVALQRGQLEELIQSLSRSRDENVLVDIEAALRVAQQQSSITGSAEPLVATLKQADERLARYSEPRLEGVRRAIHRDLDRVRATGVADLASLSIRLDEAVRLVDDLPLLAVAEPRKANAREAANARANAPKPPPPQANFEADPRTWWPALQQRFAALGDAAWDEVRSLVRVTRIEQPEAMLLAPEQMFFVRENLKLRLLNARLALLSRQFDTAQADLQSARTTLERYFDRNARKVGVEIELLRQVAGQARQVSLPRPDETLAALATANAGH
jgi:uroporphyrin-III C-methyltransferase